MFPDLQSVVAAPEFVVDMPAKVLVPNRIQFRGGPHWVEIHVAHWKAWVELLLIVNTSDSVQPLFDSPRYFQPGGQGREPRREMRSPRAVCSSL